jgi:hypothetical protein
MRMTRRRLRSYGLSVAQAVGPIAPRTVREADLARLNHLNSETFARKRRAPGGTRVIVPPRALRIRARPWPVRRSSRAFAPMINRLGPVADAELLINGADC